MQLFFTGSFDRALSSTSTPVQLFRHTLQSVDEALAERFAKGVPVAELVRQRVWFVDELLIRAWHRFIQPQENGIALVAVGGYGRHELHPNSDIDLLILLNPDSQSSRQESLEKFLAFLWDLGLEVGHSVRTVAQCIEEAGQDISIATNLMEARLLSGDNALFQSMCELTGPDQMWPTRAFFEAKWNEQLARHRKYHGTAYNLEPNVKEGPGGLRDIQTIAWVAKRHFKTDTLEGLVARDFLTRREYEDLIRGQEFLWKVRYALHVLTGRNENRLLFDYQRTLAAQFGYQDDHRLAVENFMKDYYRTITELGRLNEMLLQLFQEVILRADAPTEIVRINKRFQSCNGFIEVTDAGVFKRYPFALLEVFLLLEQHRDLKGVRAATIRLMRDHRYLIDDRFRNDLRCRSLFMEILRQPHGVTHELRRMNRYGVLAAYFPAFGNIVGQMQYDLFHVYTVDDHTLHVLRNLRRLTVPAHEKEFPLCSRIMKRIPKPELLYLGALFHDIAKGRGGDHSELGATDAFAFCRHHGLSDHDAHLVAWLVRNHLIMSSTAQHKDISDPDVLAEFARKVGSVSRLEYLYLLTVADIRATNPALWNGWKDALLIDLYSSTRHLLGRGLDTPVNKEELITETRTAALALLGGTNAEDVNAVWSDIGEEYFLRYSPDEIAWQMRLILDSQPEDLPLIRIREETDRGGTEIFIYARDQDHLFAMTTSALDQLGLNILNARVITTSNGFTLDTYIVLDENGNTIRDPRGIREIADAIRTRVSRGDIRAARTSRRPARQLRHFTIPTQVTFSEDPHHRHTIAELTTVDRPGLLARVGQAFVECGVRLLNAKIATFGERVEDVFFITGKDNNPLNDTTQLDTLRSSLVRHLDAN
ncbi:MAG: [protein-PII] uridylyltransferase [Gammaproteobacteria bacterium]|nr:[protein-PII] uridylyltransferase [Gammaproteobacteria bacterium]